MSLKEFTAMGAQCVGGDLILNRVTVGRLRNGDCYPTDEGLELLKHNIIDVEATVIEEQVPAKKVTKKFKEAPVESDPIGDLDDLLKQ